MNQKDLNYFCKTLCNALSTSVRVYRGEDLVCSSSIYNYSPDPFIRYKDEVLKTQKKVGIFTSPLHQFYGFVDFSKDMRVVVGPTGFIVREDKILDQLMFELGVLPENREAYINALCTAPYLGGEKFASIISFLAYFLEGVKIPYENILDSSSNQTTQVINDNIKQFTASEVSVENGKNIAQSYNFELSALNLIENGRVETLKSLAKTVNVKSGKMSQTALRQIKNTFICSAVVSSRSAIKGGLDPVTAFTLSDLYIQRVEVLNDYDTINALVYEVMIDYASRVKALKYGIAKPSKFLIKCAQYVAQNLNNKITTVQMAEALHLNQTYLSTQFKIQSGISITQYVAQEKILEAERLLKFTDIPLSEISDRLCFSSQSHFQNIFKKINGVTPKAFRNEI